MKRHIFLATVWCIPMIAMQPKPKEPPKKTSDHRELDLLDIMPKELWGIVREYSPEPFALGPILKSKDPVNLVNFSFDSSKLIIISDKGFVTVWDSKTGKFLYTLNYPFIIPIPDRFYIMTDRFASADFSPNGLKIITAQHGTQEVISLWNAVTGKSVRTLPKLQAYKNFIKPQFNADGTLFFTANKEGIFVWQTEPESEYFRNNPVAKFTYANEEGRHTFYTVQFSPLNPTTLLIQGNDNTSGFVDFWDITHYTRITRIRMIGDFLNRIVLSNDGKKLATIGGRSISFWNTSTGEQLNNRNLHDDIVLALSPDLSKIATGAGDIEHYGPSVGSFIHVSSTITNDLLYDLKSKQNMSTVRFSPDSEFIATFGRDNSVGIWDTTTGKELQQIPGQNVQWSPDGSTIAIWARSSPKDPWIIHLWSKLSIWSKLPISRTRKNNTAPKLVEEKKTKEAEEVEQAAAQEHQNKLLADIKDFLKTKSAMLDEFSHEYVAGLLSDLQRPGIIGRSLDNIQELFDIQQEYVTEVESILDAIKQTTPTARAQDDRIIARIRELIGSPVNFHFALQEHTYDRKTREEIIERIKQELQKTKSEDVTSLEDDALHKQRVALAKAFQELRADNETLLNETERKVIANLVLRLSTFEEWQLDNARGVLTSMKKQFLRVRILFEKIKKIMPAATLQEASIIARIKELMKDESQTDEEIIKAIKSEFKKRNGEE